MANPADKSIEPVLLLQGVTKWFGDFRAVNDVTLSLPAGSIYGFLGPNGAGKTTTLRMILDIIKPTEGTIRILGEASAMEVRHRIGYLPEEKGLYKKMKTWAVIAYFATLKGMTSKAAKRRAYELLERHGLKEFADKPTDSLSKGMGQKVQMLASIAHNPDLVILDEPFSGLDPVNQQVMEDIIRDMAALQKTVLFSTHVMQHAERLCDRIFLMAKGRGIFDGTVSEAKRTIPRRVRLETQQDIGPIRALRGVLSARALVPSKGEQQDFAGWELEIAEHADPQSILQMCFDQGIRLHSFNQADPTLHEVFMRLVEPDGREGVSP